MTQFLHVSHLKVTGANVLSASWLVSPAQVIPALMFSHNMGRRTGFSPTGVAIVHHDYNLVGEWFSGGFGAYQRTEIGAGVSGNKVRGPSQPTILANMELSLYIEFEGDPPSESALKKFFEGGIRFSGGTAQIRKPNSGYRQIVEGVKKESGFWIVDRTDLVDPKQPLNSIVNNIGFKNFNKGKDSWLCPAVLAHVMAEGPIGTGREDYPQYYGEPCVGLVQYISVHEYKDFCSSQTELSNRTTPILWWGTIPVWRMNWNEVPDLDENPVKIFFVTQSLTPIKRNGDLNV
jgi:CRISPR-associated protein Csy2